MFAHRSAVVAAQAAIDAAKVVSKGRIYVMDKSWLLSRYTRTGPGSITIET